MHLSSGSHCRRKAVGRRNVFFRSFEFTPLESRLMLSGDVAPLTRGVRGSGGPHFDLIVNARRMRRLAASTAAVDGGAATLSAATYALNAVPAFNSNPAAKAQLYLDFDGEPAGTWGFYNLPATPAYDQDSSPTSFSDGELASIRQIWARVAEKYSPFNVNVTTVNPGSFLNGQALRVVIGGTGTWTGGTYGGVANVGSFYDVCANAVYVFSANFGGTNVKCIAEAAAHEAGHGFGLEHQSTYDSSGTKTNEYNPGNSMVAPIVGLSYYSARGLWWRGTSTTPTKVQDDMAVLAGANNAFGYRADDIGNTISTGAPLLVSGSTASGSGVIDKTTDRDYFSFTTDAGIVSFSGSVMADGPTLDLKLELWSAGGSLIATADTATFGESLSATVAAGSYRLVVASHGSYGDVGQYTVSGTIIPALNYVNAPASLAGSVVSATQINLTWVDQSNNETGFVIQRSTDNGLTWSNLASTAANVTTYLDATAAPGTAYVYHVNATGASTISDVSNTVSVTTVPAAPANLAATASNTEISLAWSDVVGETGYHIERSNNGVSGWVQVAVASVNATSYKDAGLAMGTSYYYRVFGTGVAGESQASNVAAATTKLLSVPAAPTDLVARLVKNKIKLAWRDNSSNESGFKLERSTDGLLWSPLATLGTNTTSYTGSRPRSGTYYYRVCAYNAAGNSPFSLNTQIAFGLAVTRKAASALSPSQTTGLFSSKRIGAKAHLSVLADVLWSRARVLG